MNYYTNYHVYLYVGISDEWQWIIALTTGSTFMLVYLMSVNELCTNYGVYLYVGISDECEWIITLITRSTFMLVYLMSVNELLH